MLADVILESELSIELVEKLFDATVESKHRKGDVLLKQGDTKSPIFIVTEGFLRMFYYDAKGNDITHWFAAEENIITDPETYFDQAPSKYQIEALEDCTIRSLELKELNRLCKEHHEIEHFGRMLTLRISMELNRKLMDIQFKSAKERYARLIAEKPDVFQRTKLGHIASYLGITQVSLSRIRADF